jgi:hypothetical protein
LLWWQRQVIRVETQQLLVAADDAVAALAADGGEEISAYQYPRARFNCVMASDVLVMESGIGFFLRNWTRSVSRHA